MNNLIQEHEHHDHEGGRACMSRRAFLLAGASLVSLAAIPAIAFSGAKAALASFPKKKVGSLSALKTGQPLEFTYPFDNVSNILVKLGSAAGGGVGKDKDVVAFNQQCTHMGGPLQGAYKGQHQVLGPCPLHLTTFDLSRHGMVVSGHGTESLPQILLETSGDDIYAVGVMGLIYGYSNDLGA